MARPSKWEGLLIEKLKERVARYRVRDPSIIYIHNLDKPVYYWFNEPSEEKIVNGYVLMGELLHAGLEKIIEPGTEKCKTVWLPRGFPRLLDRRVAERFIHWNGNNPYCIVCGSPDGIIEINGFRYPVELKTMRRSLSNMLPEVWLRRPKLYGWLYGSRIAYLIVVNVVTAEERDVEVRSYSDEEVERIIRKWLLGKWPIQTLPSIYNKR